MWIIKKKRNFEEKNMMDNKRLKDVVDDLRLIERTRLLCNTSKELEQMVGFTISGNGLARMGGQSLFMKEAIFRELAHIAKTQTDLDLKIVIDTYRETNLILKTISKRVVTEDFLLHLINHYFREDDSHDDISCVTSKAELRHIPILLLMLMHILPQPTARGGDVRDIKSDYKRMFTLMHKSVNEHIPMKQLPALLEMEDEVRRLPDVMNRFHLIYTTAYILSAYGRISTRKAVAKVNEDLSKMQTKPEIEGIWTDGTASTQFWHFVSIDNGFQLFHYTLNNEKKRLTFTKYFIKFFEKEKYSLAIVVHPKASRYIFTNQPTPNQYVAYLRWKLEDDELLFAPIYENDKWFTLGRLKKSNRKFLQQVVEDEQYERQNLFQSETYTFSNDLAAITEDAIYIHAGDGTFYTVPKSVNEILESVHFGMTIGVVKFNDATYINFDDFNLIYDISDDEKRMANQISIVKSIDA